MIRKPKIDYKKVNTNWNRLIRFDEIRFYKLIEIMYYAIIAFFLAIFLGPLLNILTPKLNDTNEDNLICLDKPELYLYFLSQCLQLYILIDGIFIL